jgi:hypothetical protein
MHRASPLGQVTWPIFPPRKYGQHPSRLERGPSSSCRCPVPAPSLACRPLQLATFHHVAGSASTSGSTNRTACFHPVRQRRPFQFHRTCWYRSTLLHRSPTGDTAAPKQLVRVSGSGGVCSGRCRDGHNRTYPVSTAAPVINNHQRSAVKASLFTGNWKRRTLLTVDYVRRKLFWPVEELSLDGIES